MLELREAFVEAFRETGRVILRAPTGSGKSTQAPQMLLDAGLVADDEQIVVLQPRRLAARLLAKRIASERGVRLGEEVGYQVRFESRSGPRTRILLVTEGILLRRWMANPGLPGVGAVLIDEFHERHLYGDLLLSLIRDLQEQGRPGLKLGVMSATLEAGPLEEFLAPCRLVESEGRSYPVGIEYLKQEPLRTPPWAQAAEVLRNRFSGTDGHALVFMPGAYEIQRTVRLLRDVLPGGVPVLPLYGELSAADQDAAVEGDGRSRVIVATNVAETSITVEGVSLVVDSGVARVARFDPTRGMNTLYVEKISRASADQRAGRAGRTRPGTCVRLWTERDHERRRTHELPEVQRVDLSETYLTLAAGGITDPAAFRWYEAPVAAQHEEALRLLRELGALDEDGITSLGARMAKFPCHPRLARIFLAAEELDCRAAAALIAALTQGRPVLPHAGRHVRNERDRLFEECRSDFTASMQAFQMARRSRFRVELCKPYGIHADACRQVDRAFRQFLSLLGGKEEELAILPSEETVARCVLTGYPDHVARLRSRGTALYDVSGGRRAKLPLQSFADGAELLVAAEILEVERGGEVDAVLGMACPIEEAWLEEMFPHDFSERALMEFDPIQKRVIARRERCFCDLALSRRDGPANPGPEATRCLAEAVEAGTIHLKHWTEAVETWIRRFRFVCEQMPELQLAPLDETARRLLLNEICDGAVSGREVKERPVLPIVQSWLPAQYRGPFETWVPERVSFPGGKRGRFHYPEREEPYLAARIQDLYDVREVPRLCGGRFTPSVQILAPNNRPVQVTRDLASFWREHYPKLKPQLSRRYPKHEWR